MSNFTSVRTKMKLAAMIRNHIFQSFCTTYSFRSPPTSGCNLILQDYQHYNQMKSFKVHHFNKLAIKKYGFELSESYHA